MNARRWAALMGLALVFTATGSAGLVAEQAFEKLLGTLLGISTPASATVLAAYFGGLTLGAALYAKRSRRAGTSSPRTALRTYAALELVVAAACVVLALGFHGLVPAFTPLLRLGAGSAAGLLALRLVVAAVFVLPLTIPMGATFPAIVDALDGVPPARRGTAISAFYAANLGGAILAATFAPYLLFARHGVNGALFVGASLDALAAVVAFATASSFDVEKPAAEAPTSMAPPAPPRGASAPRLRSLVFVAAFSGFTLFALEVVWTHLIGTVIGSSVYAFATMLAVVLSGLGLGAAVVGLVGVRTRPLSPLLPALALFAAALALLASHGRWPEAPHELAQAGKLADTFADSEIARGAMAARLLFAPAAALGMVYPLLLRSEGFPREGAGAAAGIIAAANTVACIAGALVSGFVMVPAAGAEGSLRILAALCLVAAAVLAWSSVPSVKVRAAVLAFGAIGLGAVATLPRWNRLHLTSGEQVYFRRTYVWENTTLRYFREDTRGGFTTVVENAVAANKSRVLLTNGKFQGNDTGEMPAQDGFALAPMFVTRGWDDALVIGLGTGRSAFVATSMGFPRVTVAEIAPAVVEAARTEFAHVNGGVLDRPHVRLAVEDARNTLLLEPQRYDFVTTEISSVWLAGATSLYSCEFYDVVKSRLRPAGVFQQWIQIHHVGYDDIATVIASMRRSFAFVSFFLLGKQGILVGSDVEQIAQPEAFVRLEAHARTLGSERSPSVLAHDVLAGRILSPADVDAMLAAERPTLNTDTNRRLEYTTPRYGFDRNDHYADNVAALARWSSGTPVPIDAASTGAAADAARTVDAAAIRKMPGR